jgi:hypothetical protein
MLEMSTLETSIAIAITLAIAIAMVDDTDDVDVSSIAGKVDVDLRRRSTSIDGRFNGPLLY